MRNFNPPRNFGVYNPRHLLLSSAIAMLSALLLTGCGGPKDAAPPSLTGTAQLHGSSKERLRPSGNTLRFVDENDAPVPGQVLIGPKSKVPFTDNFLTTDANGEIALPSEWVDRQPVTVIANGFVRTTYLSQSPAPATFRVRHASQGMKLEVKGKAIGFGNLPKDGWVDVGLIVPTMSRGQMAAFSMSQMVSPEVDTIKIMGRETEIPSNVTIPRQTENYILPITLNKPDYRIYFNREKKYRIAAIHARFPLKEVVDAIQDGGSFMDAINFFQFKEASLRDVVAQRSGLVLDMPINEMVFNESATLVAPQYDPSLSMLAIAMVPTNSNEFFPSDVRAAKPGQTIQLGFPKNSQGLIVSALRKPDANDGVAMEEMSLTLHASNLSSSREFLPLVSAPSVRGQSLNLAPPQVPPQSRPLITYMALSSVAPGAGDMKVETKTPLWEIFSNEWSTQIELPEVPALSPGPGNRLRWESAFLATDLKTSTPDVVGADAMSVYTHVTRNATDL